MGQNELCSVTNMICGMAGVILVQVPDWRVVSVTDIRARWGSDAAVG